MQGLSAFGPANSITGFATLFSGIACLVPARAIHPHPPRRRPPSRLVDAVRPPDDRAATATETGHVNPVCVTAERCGIAGRDLDGHGVVLHEVELYGARLRPDLFYESAVSTLRLRILDDATVLLDRDFTALGEASTKIDSKTGAMAYKIKTLSDGQTTDRVKFGYASGNGKMTVVLDALTLGAITDGEAHLTIEVTIGSRVYTTDVTFFEGREGSYSTSDMPMAPAP
jgi:hypothetical protein